MEGAPELEAQGGRLDRLDLLYVRLVVGFGAYVYLLWTWNNYVRVSPFAVQVLLLLPAAALARWCTRGLPAGPPVRPLPHAVLHATIFLTVCFWVLPVLEYPAFPVGQSFKDLHDGIALHIADLGRPPIRGFPVEGVDVPWINSDRGGYFSTYSNAMHGLGAVLVHLGWPPLHALAGAMALAAVVASYVAYLVTKELFGSAEIAAVVGGAVTLTSFRVPLSFSITAPQAFAMALTLPSVWSVWLAERWPGWRRSVAAGLLLGLLAAAYQGPVVVVAGGLVGLGALRRFVRGGGAWVGAWARTAAAAAPLVAIALAAQGPLYFENLSGIYAFKEPSQFVLPFARPVLVLALLPAVALLLSRRGPRTSLALLVVGFAALLALTLPIDLAIHTVHPLHTMEDRQRLTVGGLLGGARHQQISRVALMQPYFFAPLLGAYALVLSRAGARWTVGIALLFLLALARVDVPLYRMVDPLIPHAFVRAGSSRFPLLSTDYTFFDPPENWDAELNAALEIVAAETGPDESVFYAPIQRWSPNRYYWIPIVLRRRVGSWVDIGTDREERTPAERLDERDLRAIEHLGFAVLLLDQPGPEVLALLRRSTSWREVPAGGAYRVFRRLDVPGGYDLEEVGHEVVSLADGPPAGWLTARGAWSATGGRLESDGAEPARLVRIRAVDGPFSLRLELATDAGGTPAVSLEDPHSPAGAAIVKVLEGGRRLLLGVVDPDVGYRRTGACDLGPFVEPGRRHLRLDVLADRIFVHVDGRHAGTILGPPDPCRIALLATPGPVAITGVELVELGGG